MAAGAPGRENVVARRDRLGSDDGRRKRRRHNGREDSVRRGASLHQVIIDDLPAAAIAGKVDGCVAL
jgi:hypothetical protein